MKYFIAVLVWITALFSNGAAADDTPAGPSNKDIEYKLTVSSYSAEGLNAKDINLRAKLENQTVWLAYYAERPSHFNQARTGYERTDKWERLKLVSSVQAADYGYLGISTTAEIGGTLHAIAGYGRSNLKPYDNINFDPNDQITWGAGWEKDENEDVALYRVRDNRVIKGQQIDHLLAHLPLGEDKLIIDLFNKSGTRDDEGRSINATGLGLGYESKKYYVRVVYDPKVNFTQTYMSRVSLGMYF